MVRRWEYANPFIVEFPIHVLSAIRCLLNGISPYTLLKADYILDHGGVGASKARISEHFECIEDWVLLPARMSVSDQVRAVKGLKFPLILKPDYGRIGNAVVRIHNKTELEEYLRHVDYDLVAQRYIDLPEEYGIFYVQERGVPRIFSINSKEFPHVVGDGHSSVRELIESDERLARFIDVLSKERDYNDVPKKNEVISLSYVGNHAQGAVFYDITHQATQKLLDAIHKLVPSGFHYGRFDVKAQSLSELRKGNFTVIEVNGVDSLSTSIFDPSYTLFRAYKILLKQYGALIRIAKEHKDVRMARKPFWMWFRELRNSEHELVRAHTMSLSHR